MKPFSKFGKARISFPIAHYTADGRMEGATGAAPKPLHRRGFRHLIVFPGHYWDIGDINH
jgi:hypothetical protein